MKLRLPNKNIQPSIYEYRFNTSQYKPFSNPNTFQQFNSTHYPSPATTIQCSSNITPSTSFYDQTTFTSFPKTSSPFKLTQVHPFTPTLQEHHKLSTYYQTTETDEDKYYYNKHHKKHLSQENWHWEALPDPIRYTGSGWIRYTTMIRMTVSSPG